MTSKELTVINETGLHARPASDFVALAKRFASTVKVRNVDSGRPAVNAKSVLRVLGEGMGKGTRIEISAEGADEAKKTSEADAVETLIELVASGFGE